MPLPCLIGLDGPELSPAEESAISRFQPAGFVLFSRNICTIDQVRNLTDRLRQFSIHRPIIAIDQEGGRVVRTASLGLHLPSPRTMRQPGACAEIPLMASLTAASLRYMGVNTDFAPVLDICHDEAVANALQGRCWGTDAGQVVSLAGVFNAHLTAHGVAGCGKHFPGMGLARNDPHHGLPVIDVPLEDLLRSDLVPFLSLAPQLPSLMTAHILLPSIDADHPATLSPSIVTGLLRNQFYYKGIVFTDDLCMGAISRDYGIAEAAVMALDAGCDLPLICHDALPHLERLAAMLPERTDYDAIDREKRLERFMKRVSPPLPLDRNKWNALLDDIREFVGRHPENISGTIHSPVEGY